MTFAPAESHKNETGRTARSGLESPQPSATIAPGAVLTLDADRSTQYESDGYPDSREGSGGSLRPSRPTLHRPYPSSAGALTGVHPRRTLASHSHKGLRRGWPRGGRLDRVVYVASAHAFAHSTIAQMDSVSASTPRTAIQPGDTGPFAPRNIAKFLYPMRIIGVAACIVIAAFYVNRFGPYRLYYVFLLLFAVSYPHISRVLYRRTRSRKVELGTLVVDAFILGSTVYVTGFSLLPALTLTTVALANGLALNGLPLMRLSALSAALGMTGPMAFYGLNFHPRDLVEINLTCAVFLFVYFNVFAYTAYTRTILLQASRRELKQQKITVEIEKKQSDNLLLSLLPADVAREFDASGSVRPQRYDSVTILVVDFENFSEMLRTLPPEELLAELNHCFKAFDAITGRHCLESLRTFGGTYIAAGGLPVVNDTHPTDAVRAALEIQDFMRELKTSRRAHGRGCLEPRIGVHTGPVVAGVIETQKFSYELWGDTVDTALRIPRHVGVSAVGISDQTWRWVKDHFPCTPAGTVRSGEEDEIAVYALDLQGPADIRLREPRYA